MEVENKSLSETFEELTNNLKKNNSVKEMEAIHDFIKTNKASIFNNKIIPYKLSINLLKYISSTSKFPDIIFKIYELYVDEFFTTKNYPEDEIDNLKGIIFTIFNIESIYYSQTSTLFFPTFLKEYINKYYPRDTTIIHKVGDVMELCMSDSISDKIIFGWYQMEIKQVDTEKKLYTFIDPFFKDRKIELSFEDYRIKEKNTFVKEEEMIWRENLKINDKVDFFNYTKDLWVEAYIKEINILGQYLIQPVGEPENFYQKKAFSKYSPYIQPLYKYSYKYDPEDKECFKVLKAVEEHHKYRYYVPTTENNYTILCEKMAHFSFYYYDILNFFLKKLFSSNVLMDESISIMFIYIILYIIKYCNIITNMRYFSKYFYENCYEHLKNVFYKYSLSKEKYPKIAYGWKAVIQESTYYMDYFLAFNDYFFNLCYFQPEFGMTVGYNCFKSGDNLEKKHLGLSRILDFFPYLQRYYLVIGPKAQNKIKNFVHNTLFNIDNKNDLITLIYSDVSLHEELLSKGNEIMIKFSEIGLLTDKHIEHLYNLANAAQENTDLKKYAYLLLDKIISNLSLKQKENIFYQIILFPYDKIKKCDIDVAQNLLKNITSKESFLLMANSFLEYYYKYITEYKNFDDNYNKDFGKIISYAKDADNLILLYKNFFKKILEDITKQNNLEKYRNYFTLIHSIYNSFYNIDQKNINVSNIKEELKKIFYEYYSDNGIIVDKILELYNLDKNEKNEDYLMDIIDIVNGFIKFIGDQKYFNVDSTMKLSDFFIFGNKSKKNRKNFIQTIKNMEKDELDLNQLYEKLFEKTEHYLDKIALDNSDIDNDFISLILSLYEKINNKEPDVKNKTPMEIFMIQKDKYLEKKDPLKNKYFDTMWKMFYKSKNTDNINNFLQDFSLKNFTPKERYEIWEKIIQKIFSNFDSNILVSLTMLKEIIKISEKYGNANVISHICDLYSKEYKRDISLKFDTNSIYFINIKTAKNKEYVKWDLHVSCTIYDIKYLIEMGLGYDPIVQEITTKDSKEIKDDSLPLFKIFPHIIKTNENAILINLKRSNVIDNLPQYPLLSEDNSELTDKFIEVIFNIFSRYTNDDKLYSLGFASFIKDIYEPFNKTKYEMEDIFMDKIKIYFKDNKFITLDDFLLYFANEAQTDIGFTYRILENLGFTKSLDSYLYPLQKDNILYYEKNNIKENMPRYFIGNNLEYMKKLFNYLKTEDENIYNLAKDIIYELSTPEIFKNIIFENNESNDNIKLDELLFDDNLELKVYLYDIIITVFNDEKNYDRKVVDIFINNKLDKIINEFDKINKKENANLFNNKQYIRYYSSIVKLLLLCFKNIIENKELNDYIEKFKADTIDFTKFIIDLNEEKQNLIKKINIKNLLYIILNNLISLNEKENEKEISTISSAQLIIYLLLIISYYSEDNEKTEIYKKFLENQMNILIKCVSYSLSSNMYTLGKLIFPLINMEKNLIFIKLLTEEICNNLKDYKKLNTIKEETTYLFDLITYLYEEYKDINNDEIYELLEYILNIILENNINIQKKVIEGYLNVINTILNILKKHKYEKIYEYNFGKLISKFINDYLITFEKDKYEIINNLDNYDVNYFLKITIYDILTIIIELNPEKNIRLFFENENIKKLREKHLTKLEEDKTKYFPYEELKYKYVGLFNPSALCYINSVIQQFFMLPLFQHEILSFPKNQNLNYDIDNDDFLFQLQKMFYNLKYGLKKYYNPKSFVLSFKDSQGKSPNINEQCDAQEFLIRFIEKIDETLKNTKNKYLCENIFGGNTLQQIKCTNPKCGNISERKDQIYYLSLEIKNKSKLTDCLNGFIVEEKIEDYHCEKCDKKITHIKKVLIDQIPNILIIHLQRFVFNYTTFTMEKLNTPVKFEETLNIKNYTVNKDNDNIPLEYFDYELQGALIHSGQHQYGHYYSLIYNKQEKNFYEFNDIDVRRMELNKGMELAFGSYGDNKNAYMLIYTKKIKKPIIINNKSIDDNIQKIIEEKNNLDKIEGDDGKIYYLYENEKEAFEKNINMDNEIKNIIIKNDKSQAELISYDKGLNSLIEENKNSYETKPFINEILTNNIKLINDNNFYMEQFTSFIKTIIELIKKEITNDETKQKLITYIPILKILNDNIINIISVSNEKDDLPKIVDNLIDIYKYSKNEELISYLIKYIEQIKENIFKGYLVSKDRVKGRQIGKYIAKIICLAIDSNIEKELANNIIQYYIDKIPIEITKKWLDMEAFNEFIYQIIENSDIIKRNFIKTNMISKLIDFILGKKSPLYKGDERSEFINTKGYFGPIIKSIALLFKYYDKNILDEDMTLSDDDINLINHEQFYDKIVKDNYESNATNLLIDIKINLVLAINIKENMPINDQDILDYLINKRIEKIKTNEDINSYLDLLVNIIKKYSLVYLNKDNDLLLEKLNILLGLPIPTVNFNEAEIIYVSGKYYGKNTILTKLSKNLEINKDMIILLITLFDLITINDFVFNYVDNLPSPNSFKYSYVDYIIKLFLSYQNELKKIDETAINKLSDAFILIFQKHNKKDLDDISVYDELYFSNFSYELKNNEKIDIYEVKIKYTTLKKFQKTDLELFNKTTFFSNLNNKDKIEEQKEEKKEEEKEGNQLDTFICALVFCNDDLDINIEFKPYFNSKLEIKGKKNCHYIFYCTKEEKTIDYSKIKIETKVIQQPQQPQQQTSTLNQLLGLPQDMKLKIALPTGLSLKVPCEVCGIENLITSETTEFKCSFCECPLIKPASFIF